MEKKDRAVKDKRYEDKHKEERKAKCMGNERTERESRENKRVFEKIRLHEGTTNRSGI